MIESKPENPQAALLEHKIRQLIGSQGPLAFRRFMEMALYDGQAGYYQSRDGIIGPAGDFVTSPEAGPLFGRLLALYLVGIWRDAASPEALSVWEYGAGQGALCREIAVFFRERVPDGFAALRYRLIERSATMRERLRVMLDRHSLSGCCTISETDETGAGRNAPRVVLANEFLDALPVHWVVRRGRQLMEKYVDWLDGEFILVERPATARRLQQHFEWLGLALADGQETTISLAALEWLERLSRLPFPLRVLIIDYGFQSDNRHPLPEPSNTPICYRSQTSNRRPLLQVGAQDMTCHVDFSALIRKGRELGFEVRRQGTQLEFLLELVGRFQGWIDWEENLELRLNLKELVHPEHMGETFKVLELASERP